MFSTVQNRLENTLSYFGYGSQPSLPREIHKSLENQVPSAESTLQDHRVSSTPPSIWKRVASLCMSYLVFSSGQSSLGETFSFGAGGYAPDPRALSLTFVAGLSTFPDIAHAQSSSVTFFKTFGGLGDEEGQALIATSEGDLIVAGETSSVGVEDIDVLLSKFSSNGTLVWARTFGGANSDYGYALMSTIEGDLIVAGHTRSFGAGSIDLLLSKFSSNGTLLWANTLGGTNDDRGYALTVTSEEDLIVVGQTSSFGAGGIDVLLSKFSSNGTLIWAKTLGGANNDWGKALKVTSEGDVILTGYTNSFGAGESDALLSRFSSNGTLIWAKTLGGPSSDLSESLMVTSEGDLIVSGFTSSFGAGGSDALLSRFSSNGTLIWANTLGGIANDLSRAFTASPEGDLIVAGYTNSFGAGSNDVLLSKFLSNGSLVWANILGEANSDRVWALTVTPEGDLIVAGDTYRFGVRGFDVLLAKFNAQGVIENCSAWQTVTPQVQSIVPNITDVTLNMTTDIPPWTSQDARSALNVTDITNRINQTTVCDAQTAGSRTTTFLKSSSPIFLGTPSLKGSPSSSPQPSENFISTDERGSVHSQTVQFGSTHQPNSLTSVSTSERIQTGTYVTIESIISAEVIVINHPLYGDIPVSYDAETNTLYLSIDLSEFEDGDEIELFTYASNYTVDDLSIIVEGYSTCKTLENAGAEEEESDRSVYVARVVDKSCTSGTSSICISFSTLFATTASILPSK